LGLVRQRALLSLSLPVAALGSLGGHAAGYALVGTTGQDARIHGYLVFAPQFVAVCAVFVAASVALRVSGRFAGRPAAWPFAVLPPLAFAVQELIERLAAGLPARTVFAPAVYAGLVAQLPMAIAAFFVARTLLRVADGARRWVAMRPPAPRPRAVPVGAAGKPLLARAPLAFDRLGRAPPQL
jgi:hypothetical protein